ncbi:MAG: hypothetical protein ACUZ8I_15040, partial [Candidatus Scalindua sp.]
MSSPKKNVSYEFDIALIDTADTGAFKAAPTLATGDFKVSTDNGALADLTTLPVVSPAGSIIVKINLSQAEMNGNKIMVQCIDAAGAEWDDVLIFIDATVVNVDDVVRSTTPANTLDVAASGEAEADVTKWLGTATTAATAGRPDVNIKALDNRTLAAQVLSLWLDEGVNETAQSGTATTLTTAALTQSDNYWNGSLLIFRSGSNVGRTRIITDFDS